MGETILTRVERFMEIARKEGDKERLECYKLIKSALTKENNNARYVLTEEMEHKVLNSMVKEWKGAIEDYKKGNRQDLIDQRTREISIFNEFLPEQPSEEEMVAFIKSVIEQHIASKGEGYTISMRDMGAIMPLAKEKYPLIDGNLVKNVLNGSL